MRNAILLMVSVCWWCHDGEENIQCAPSNRQQMQLTPPGIYILKGCNDCHMSLGTVMLYMWYNNNAWCKTGSKAFVVVLWHVIWCHTSLMVCWQNTRELPSQRPQRKLPISHEVQILSFITWCMSIHHQYFLWGTAIFLWCILRSKHIWYKRG